LLLSAGDIIATGNCDYDPRDGQSYNVSSSSSPGINMNNRSRNHYQYHKNQISSHYQPDLQNQYQSSLNQRSWSTSLPSTTGYNYRNYDSMESHRDYNNNNSDSIIIEHLREENDVLRSQLNYALKFGEEVMQIAKESKETLTQQYEEKLNLMQQQEYDLKSAVKVAEEELVSERRRLLKAVRLLERVSKKNNHSSTSRNRTIENENPNRNNGNYKGSYGNVNTFSQRSSAISPTKNHNVISKLKSSEVFHQSKGIVAATPESLAKKMASPRSAVKQINKFYENFNSTEKSKPKLSTSGLFSPASTITSKYTPSKATTPRTPRRA